MTAIAIEPAVAATKMHLFQLRVPFQGLHSEFRVADSSQLLSRSLDVLVSRGLRLEISQKFRIRLEPLHLLALQIELDLERTTTDKPW